MKRFSITAGIMTLVLFVSVLVGVSDVVSAQGQRGDHHGKGFWSNLTEEQREAVQEKTKEMRSQDATREEIRAAEAEMLKGYGIEVPEDWAGPHGRGGFGPGSGGFLKDLTEEQREAVYEKMKEMRDQGATREEIHSAVAEMLEGYGIEVPEDWRGPDDPGGFGPGPGGFWEDLTEEQREAVHEKIKEMRDQGATREEIHSAVAEMLKGYGIELPEQCRLLGGPEGLGHDRGGFMANLTDEQREAIQEKTKEMRSQGATREEIRAAKAEMLKGYGIELPEQCRLLRGPGGLGHDRGGFMADLTDEQREAVQEKTKEMRSQGATREEIHAAVTEMLKGYGIEVPEDWAGPHGPGGFGPGPGGFLEDLTEEQREAVHEKIKEMRDQGATREEIRAAVAELLEGFGIELPEDSGNTSSETASVEPYIQAQSYPNPFNPQTEIAYSLPEDSYVKLTIYNIQGQKVTTLLDEYQSAGTKKIIWDGCDESGKPVASGVYLYRIDAGPHAVTNRMVLLK